MAKSTIRAEAARIRVDALSTSNLTLSGTQTIDDIAVGVGDLVGAMNQSNGKSGVYVVQDGAWLAADPGFGTGLEVYASAGTANQNKIYGCDTVGAIDWGTTSTTFTLKSQTGAVFDPAAPGTLGGTTPGVVNASSLYLTGTTAAPVADKTQLIRIPTGFIAVNPTGERQAYSMAASASTATVLHYVAAVTIPNDSQHSLANSGGGFFRVSKVGESASIFAAGAFAEDATATFNGSTYTGCTTVIGTPASLNIGAESGNLAFENKTGSSGDFLIEVLILVAV